MTETGHMAHQDPITTIVIDDNPDIRLLIRLTLEAPDSRCVVVGEGTCGQEAIDLFEALGPDCVVIDVRMPGMDGIEAAARIHELNPTQPVVFCSAHAPSETLHLRSCDTFLPKQQVDLLPEAVDALVSGRRYPPYLADAVSLPGASSTRSGQNGGS